jgi:hypothetical protein
MGLTNVLPIFLIGCLPLDLFAQNGCTDPAANNFDPDAVYNDGSCQYAQLWAKPVIKASLSHVRETSGLVYTDGKLWTFGDSGNPPDIFSVDTTTGNTLQTVNISNYPNTDWEDIAADSDYLYIADLGNNEGNRTDLKILKVAKHDIGNGTVVGATAQAIFVSFTDQTSFVVDDNTNFDCEAIISKGDSLYLFTKDHGDFRTRVYAVSKTPGTYRLSPYTSFNVNGKITGADFNPATGEIALIGYMSSKFNSFLWLLNDFRGSMFFSGNKRRVEIGNSTTSWQTEGITYTGAVRFFISCETTSAVAASLYTLDKKDISSSLSTRVQDMVAEGNLRCFPNPASGQVTISGMEDITRIEASAISGEKLFDTFVQGNSYVLPLSMLHYGGGLLLLRITTQSGVYFRRILVVP